MNKIREFHKCLGKYLAIFFLVGGLTLPFYQSVSAASSILVPRGFIDAPAANGTVQGTTMVRGWFLNGSGVSKVEVLVDGKVMGTATYGLLRSDVQRAYPDYKNNYSGYQFSLNSKLLTNGTHQLSVRETGGNGVQTTIRRTVKVSNLPAQGIIDSPAANSAIRGTTTVQGWFLDGSGVSKVEVLVDGKVTGTAAYGLSRPDVYKVYPQYGNNNAGYQYTLDTGNLTSGRHTLAVRETSVNGTQKTISRAVTVQNLSSKGTIDDPAGRMVQGIAAVRGWFLDRNSVSKIEVYIDGRDLGAASYGQARPDVYDAYPQYQNNHSGYQYSLNTWSLTNGTHQLSVRETGVNGTQITINRTISVNNMLARGVVDSPAANSTIKGVYNLQGWFLDGSGVSKVEVLVDGSLAGNATYGLARPDVYHAYPQYKNGNSGYQYALDTKKLKPGSHTLSIRETGKDGVQATISRKMNVGNLPARGVIDTPAQNSTIRGTSYSLRGWFLDGSSVSKVEVLVDGSLKGTAVYGQARPDVSRAYPQYNNNNSGFQFSLDTTKIGDGAHKISIRETAGNGVTTEITSNVNIKNYPYEQIDLRKPANITAQDIIGFFNAYSSNSPLKNDAQYFINAQNRYGVNAQYLVAQAIWETGWGQSELYKYKHNLYGYGAFDVAPFTCGYYFPTDADSINYAASQIRSNYLNATGSYYSAVYGPTLIGMNQFYATDQNWKNGIASIMQEIKPYDASYYQKAAEILSTATDMISYGTDIPVNQPYPSDVIIDYPSGKTAMVVNASSVNLRSLPYVSASTSIGSAKENTVVNVLGYNTDVSYDPGGSDNYAFRWYRVSINGQNGWIYGEYLKFNN